MTIGIFICWVISIVLLLCVVSELTRTRAATERIAAALEKLTDNRAGRFRSTLEDEASMGGGDGGGGSFVQGPEVTIVIPGSKD